MTTYHALPVAAGQEKLGPAKWPAGPLRAFLRDWLKLPARLARLARMAAVVISAAAATATAAESAAAALGLGASFVDRQRTPAGIASVQRGDGRIRLLVVGHFHEPEAARPAGIAIGDHRYAVDGSVGSEPLPQIRFRGM